LFALLLSVSSDHRALHSFPTRRSSDLDQTCADPAALADFIEERRLTMWCSVPTPIRCAARFRTLEDRDCSSLRHVAWCGDVLPRSEEHTSELQSRENLVCRLLLEKKKT